MEKKSGETNFSPPHLNSFIIAVVSSFVFLSSVLCYLYISFSLSPLNEEEWLPEERNFIVGVKNGEIFYNSEEKRKNTARKLGINIELGLAETHDENSGVFIGFVERDLPPKLLFVAGDWKVPLLGWGHVGPVSLVLMRVWDTFVEITGLEELMKNPAVFRWLNILILIFAYPALLTMMFMRIFRYRPGNILIPFVFYVFFLSFPINIFFITSATLWYLIMALLTPLSFICLASGRFGFFFTLSAFSIATHMRGIIIFISQVIYLLISSAEKEEKRNFLVSFLKFSPLIFLSFVFYIIPEFIPDSGGRNPTFDLGVRGAISFSDIMQIFLSKFFENLPLVFQFVFMRIGDFFISGNLFSLLRELGIIYHKDTLFYLLSVLATLLYFAPALFFVDRDKRIYLNMYIFFAVYFVLSIFAVPFFVGMPWQFIPVHFIPLFLSLRTLTVRRTLFELPVLPAFFGVLLSFVGCMKMKELVSPFALWEEHKKLGEVLETKGPEKKVLCVVKSDILFLFRDCDKAKFLFLHSSSLFQNTGKGDIISVEKKNILYHLFGRYDYIVLSYHFFWLVEYLPSSYYEYEYRSGAFYVLRKKDHLQNSRSPDD